MKDLTPMLTPMLQNKMAGKPAVFYDRTPSV
jgi:hypothetical protein